MKTIYIDSDYHCHTEKADGLREVETNVFDSIADEAIKYYTYVPQGERYNGVICSNVFVQCNDSKSANAVTAAVYEANAERDALLDDLASLIDEVYTMDSEMMEE